MPVIAESLHPSKEIASVLKGIVVLLVSGVSSAGLVREMEERKNR